MVQRKPGHVPNPTFQDEVKTYTASHPPGDNIPIHSQPSPINDDTPTEEEICKALQQM
jgi:hypothetical protein